MAATNSSTSTSSLSSLPGAAGGGGGGGGGNPHPLSSTTSSDSQGEFDLGSSSGGGGGCLAKAPLLQRADNLARMSAAARVLLECLGEDVTREGLVKTPLRMAKALLAMTSGYELVRPSHPAPQCSRAVELPGLHAWRWGPTLRPPILTSVLALTHSSPCPNPLHWQHRRPRTL
jgi:hypothetical protein